MKLDTSAQRRLLRLLLGAIGAGASSAAALIAPGCGADVTVTSGGSGSVGSAGGAGGAGTTSSAQSSTGDVTFGVTTSTTGMMDCSPFVKTSSQDPSQNLCGPDAGGSFINVNCLAPPTPGATCAGTYSDACVLSTYSCGLSKGGMEIVCGPITDAAGNCCYVITGDCAVGRPFTVAGSARLGSLVPGEGYRERLSPDMESLDAATRAALADVWGREALFEHASMASFARFTLELLALGAPADLVSSSQRALADELAHARACLGLASAYAGVALRPSALPIDGALAESTSAPAIAASLAREGCVAETIAALHVQRAAEQARDPVVKAALARIAEEEAEHAALAWRALAWMLATGGGEVRRAVEKVFAEAEAHVSLGATTALAGDEEAMRAHGVLPVEERRALAREALGKVVGPAVRALLGRTRVVAAAEIMRL
jgi:hypothetical protein